MTISNIRAYALATFALSCSMPLFAGQAFAHHPMGGGIPSTLAQGLISGLAHPIIGVDHLAFIIGVGVVSAFLSLRFITPLIFVIATLAGCMLQLQGVTLPLAEIVIAGSVVLIGSFVVSGAAIPSTIYGLLFAVFGLFHGWAYGIAIVGAEQTPLVAYLIGFAAIQYVIAAAVMIGVRTLWQTMSATPLRIAGGGIAGFGLAFLVENIEGLIFPGIA